MSVTASRLGSAPITLDWSNLKPQAPDPSDLKAAWDSLKGRFAAGEVGFYDSPVKNELSQLAESVSLAQSILKRKQFRDCLVLGIGGSALGPVSLLSALQEKASTGIRFHFMENP